MISAPFRCLTPFSPFSVCNVISIPLSLPLERKLCWQVLQHPSFATNTSSYVRIPILASEEPHDDIPSTITAHEQFIRANRTYFSFKKSSVGQDSGGKFSHFATFLPYVHAPRIALKFDECLKIILNRFSKNVAVWQLSFFHCHPHFPILDRTSYRVKPVYTHPCQRKTSNLCRVKLEVAGEFYP